jgi:transposase, IS5 family
VVLKIPPITLISRNPEFALIDTILEEHPELLEYVRADITQGQKASNFGRGDMPSVEQILRAALYKEMKGLTYRELEYQQTDSRICARFLKFTNAKYRRRRSIRENSCN